ncbi:hypothetical protein D3C72_2114940 [compost metagenome]
MFHQQRAVHVAGERQRQRQHAIVLAGAHVPVGQQALPGAGERFDQIALVECNDGLDALGLGGNQGAG